MTVNLQKVRRQSKITRDQMAEELGVSVITVYRWEKGITKRIPKKLKDAFLDYVAIKQRKLK